MAVGIKMFRAELERKIRMHVAWVSKHGRPSEEITPMAEEKEATMPNVSTKDIECRLVEDREAKLGMQAVKDKAAKYMPPTFTEDISRQGLKRRNVLTMLGMSLKDIPALRYLGSMAECEWHVLLAKAAQAQYAPITGEDRRNYLHRQLGRMEEAITQLRQDLNRKLVQKKEWQKTLDALPLKVEEKETDEEFVKRLQESRKAYDVAQEERCIEESDWVFPTREKPIADRFLHAARETVKMQEMNNAGETENLRQKLEEHWAYLVRQNLTDTGRMPTTPPPLPPQPQKLASEEDHLKALREDNMHRLADRESSPSIRRTRTIKEPAHPWPPERQAALREIIKDVKEAREEPMCPEHEKDMEEWHRNQADQKKALQDQTNLRDIGTGYADQLDALQHKLDNDFLEPTEDEEAADQGMRDMGFKQQYDDDDFHAMAGKHIRSSSVEDEEARAIHRDLLKVEREMKNREEMQDQVTRDNMQKVKDAAAEHMRKCQEEVREQEQKAKINARRQTADWRQKFGHDYSTPGSRSCLEALAKSIEWDLRYEDLEEYVLRSTGATPENPYGMSKAQEHAMKNPDECNDASYGRMSSTEPNVGNTMQPERERSAPSYVDKIAKTISERRGTYAHPQDNHQLTADLWELWWKASAQARVQQGGIERGPKGAIPFTPEDICMFNIIQKISRMAHGSHDDSLLDIVGYCENISMLRKDQRNYRVEPVPLGDPIDVGKSPRHKRYLDRCEAEAHIDNDHRDFLKLKYKPFCNAKTQPFQGKMPSDPRPEHDVSDPEKFKIDQARALLERYDFYATKVRPFTGQAAKVIHDRMAGGPSHTHNRKHDESMIAHAERGETHAEVHSKLKEQGYTAGSTGHGPVNQQTHPRSVGGLIHQGYPGVTSSQKAEERAHQQIAHLSGKAKPSDKRPPATSR